MELFAMRWLISARVALPTAQLSLFCPDFNKQLQTTPSAPPSSIN
jgi:hypothetical protein